MDYDILDEKYTTDKKYRAEVPLWVDDFLKEEAKNRGVNVKDLVSEILCAWTYENEQFTYKISALPSNDLYKEWKHTRAEKRREAEKERRKQQQEALGALTPERSGETISLDDIPYPDD